MLAGTSVTVDGWRGIGRSWLPNARVASRPTIDPIDIPSIAGAIIRDSPAIIDIIGSALAASSRRLVGAAERRRHLGEQVAVRLEGLGGPL